MHRKILVFLAVILLLMLPACVPNDAVEPGPTPKVISLEEDLAAEEAAADAIATVREEKTQAASRVSPYVKLSDGEKRYLAFWFTWNEETVLLPLANFIATDSGLLTCRIESETGTEAGKLYSGLLVDDDNCLVDEKAMENAPPLIKISRYFEDGVDTQSLNVIDLNGEYAENIADILTIIIKDDLLGSCDLSLSIHRTDRPGGEPFGNEDAVPTYVLPEKMLQISFSPDQMENFEDSRDVVYALEHKFTWKIPDGYNDLNLLSGDENWFVLTIREMKAGNNLEEEYQSQVYIQVKGVGTSVSSGN